MCCQEKNAGACLDPGTVGLTNWATRSLGGTFRSVANIGPCARRCNKIPRYLTIMSIRRRNNTKYATQAHMNTKEPATNHRGQLIARTRSFMLPNPSGLTACSGES
jgi:hypothetical protein